MPKKAPQEHSSWAAMVQDYRHEKVSLGWKPKELPPRKVVTKFQKTREERVLILFYKIFVILPLKVQDARKKKCLQRQH